MKVTMKNTARFFLCFFFCFIFLGKYSDILAQDIFGVGFGYEVFPYVQLAEPDQFTEDLQIQTSSRNVGIALPAMSADGKIMIKNNLNYKRVDFHHKNFPAGTPKVQQVQSVQYSLFLMDSLSVKWNLIIAMTPGIASDFGSEVSGDDFTLQAIMGLLYKYNKDFQIGFGLAYTRDFGTPLPLPFIYIDWKISPKLGFSGLLPVDMRLTYKVIPMFDIGTSFKVRGDRYHGNPEKFNVNNPQMEYSEGTISLDSRVHFTKWIHLNLEAGYAVYRNFEYLDGNESAGSYDLENTEYFRVGLVLGM